MVSSDENNPHEAPRWRLVLVLRDLGVGGAERVVVRLANYAAKNGIDTHLVTLVGAGPLAAELDGAVRLHDLQAGRIRSALAPLYRCLLALRPDTVMATLPQVNALTVLAARLLPKRPMIVLREANDPRHEAPYEQRTERSTRAVLGAAYRRADKVIAVSEGVKEGIVERYGVSPDGVVALPNASIDDRIFEEAEVELGDDWFEGLRRRVVCVARLAPQKDHETLLEAFAALPDRQGLGMVLIGDGPLRPKVEGLITSYGLTNAVRVVTGESNPYRWLRTADLLVLASRWEGSPNVLVEALTLGVPVVATDCPSGPRELLQDGRYGTLVPVGDAESLTAAIEASFEAPRDPALLWSRGMQFHIDQVGPRWLAELAPR